MTELTVEGSRPLRGRLRVPGCKGISHRALVFAAIADGESRVERLAPGADVAATATALAGLGVPVVDDPSGVGVHGVGFSGLRASPGPLDCANSATTMRMLAGLVAGRPFRTVLDGDDSLRSRPMGRVVEPLRAMGAAVGGPDDGAHAPLAIAGGRLQGRRHELAVASGQVKTALVLAGLQAEGVTEIVEPAPSRDHTERMLGALGAPLEQVDDRTVRVRAGAPRSFRLVVPGDASSAAFFVVAATLVRGSRVVLEDVDLNPGRIGYVEILRRMGAQIEVRVTGEALGEPVGELEVRAAPLHATEIESREPIVDELPVLAVAAAFAEGTTVIRGAAELRVKESDRIATLHQELTELGVRVETRPDGLVVTGGRAGPATLKSHGDHRVALAAAVAVLAVEGTSTVRGWAATAASYPQFADDLATLTERSR